MSLQRFFKTGLLLSPLDRARDAFHEVPLHQKTYVDARYKITVYYNRTYGELFDLQEDPKELRNLWNDPASAALKSELLLKYIRAELGKESMAMPRITGA